MKNQLSVITLDIESFYSKTYSLSKLTTQAYIDHHEFEVIGVAVKVNDQPTEWFSGTKEKTKEWLQRYDWDHALLVAHNALFDASILSFVFGIHPWKIADTLSMARAIHGTEVGGSLAALAKHYELGEKGTEVVNALGKRRLDFSKAEMERYAGYCINDVELTYELFKRLAPHFHKIEQALIDMTVKMHTRPQFLLDRDVLESHLYEVRERKENLLQECGISKEDLMSNPKLGEVLKKLGVEPPTKISARTGKEAYAFAKSDEEFKALLEHEDERIQAVVAARLGVKSTLEETRTERFLAIQDTNGMLPVPLKYYGAITGRWAASDSINLQNLPRGSKLKQAIVAPEGKVIVGADLSNIELRVGLYYAGQTDKVKMLGDGFDLYKDFASKAFNVAYEDVDDAQRFVGKTCIAEGELVLTERRGLIPIQDILLDDRVWDGVEWVCHDGVAFMGEKHVIEYQGLRATPDHKVYLEDGSSCQFWDAANQGARVAITGNAGLPIQRLDSDQHNGTEKQQERMFDASSQVRLWHRKMDTPRLFRARVIAVLSFLRNEKRAYSAGAFISRRCTHEEITKTSQCNATTLYERSRQRVSKLWRTRHPISVRIHCRVRRLFENITRVLSWINCRSYRQQWALCSGELALYHTERANQQSQKHFLYNMERRGDFSFGLERKPLYTNEHGYEIRQTGFERRGDYSNSMGCCSPQAQELARNKSKVRVYDIINAGPRHRFTVSNLLVSNCQLSLIYGTGAKKLRAQCKLLSGKDIGETFAQGVVDLYRQEYGAVKAAWYDAGRALDAIMRNEETVIGLGKIHLPVLGRRGIKLPSGLFMTYPELHTTTDELGRKQYVYKTRKGPVHIHAAKCYQNLIQALARCVMGEAMVAVHKRYPVGLTIHDALYCVVPAPQADEALRFIVGELKKEPCWAPGLPLDAEGGYGKSLSFKMGKVKV